MTIQPANFTSNLEEKKNHPDSFYVKNGSKLERIYLSCIICITSEGNYCTIHTDDYREYVTKRSLTTMLKMLPIGMFERIHLRTIVALDKITKVDLREDFIYLDEIKVKLGPSFRPNFIKKLNVI